MSRSGPRALALSLGLVLTAAPLGGLEAWCRWEEAATRLRFPTRQPGRKYALAPGAGRIELNALGFNERPLGAKVPGRTRVVVLGDSVTFGAGVPQDRAWPRVTEAILRAEGWDIELLNLSVYGYDIEQEAATLRHLGWGLEPDVVMLGVFTNDHIPTELIWVGQRQTPAFVGTSVPPEVALVSPELSLWASGRSAAARRLLGARAARALEEAAAGGIGGRPPGDLDWFRVHLAGLVAQAREREVPVLALGLLPHVVAAQEPEGCGRDLPLGYCEGQVAIDRQLWQVATELGLPWFDTLEAWREAAGQDFYLEGVDDPVHPNTAGHAVLGEAGAQALRQLRDGVAMDAGPPSYQDASASAEVEVLSEGSEEAVERPQPKRQVRQRHRPPGERPSSRERRPPAPTRPQRLPAQ